MNVEIVNRREAIGCKRMLFHNLAYICAKDCYFYKHNIFSPQFTYLYCQCGEINSKEVSRLWNRMCYSSAYCTRANVTCSWLYLTFSENNESAICAVILWAVYFISLHRILNWLTHLDFENIIQLTSIITFVFWRGFLNINYQEEQHPLHCLQRHNGSSITMPV